MSNKIKSTYYSDTNPQPICAYTVGLGNVDNTSDADKPISTATQTALDLKLDDNGVFDWAKSELPFTASEISDTYNSAADCFVTNPENFADGKPYFRYHAGSKNFTWTNPNPVKGALTLTVMGYSQWSSKTVGQEFTAIVFNYSDGTTDRVNLKHGQLITYTTNSNKTVVSFRGNYDLENWVLLDLTTLKITAPSDTPAPFVDKSDVVSPDENAVEGQAADAKSVWDMIGDVKSLIDGM